MWSERKPLQEKSVLMRAGDSPLFICFPPQPIYVVLPPLFLWFFPHLFLLLCSLFSPREEEAFTDKDFHILKQYSSWLSQVHSFLCLTDLHVFCPERKKTSPLFRLLHYPYCFVIFLLLLHPPVPSPTFHLPRQKGGSCTTGCSGLNVSHGFIFSHFSSWHQASQESHLWSNKL